MNAKLESVIFVLFVLCGLSIHSQEFSVKVYPQSIKCLPGVRNNSEIVITNVSGKDIWIAGAELKDGISIGLPYLTNNKGEDFSCIPPSSQSIVKARPDTPIGKKVLFGKDESWKISSGSFGEGYCPLERDLTEVKKVKYFLTIRVVEGPLVKDIRYVQAVGEVEVEFQKPEGEDLAYIKAVQDWLSKADPKEINGYTERVKPLTWGELLSSFRIPVNHILLQKFPTSTYAAYVTCPPNQWTSNTDPERILKSIETGTYLSNGSVPDDTGKSKDGWLYLGGRDLIDWRAKWIGIVLKNHPDIWYADHLKLRLAIDQIAMKNYQSGESDLDKLSREAMPEVAEKAKVYLSLMKQKGWVSAPVEKSAPEAVVVK